MSRTRIALVSILVGALAAPVAAQSTQPSSGEGFHVGFGAAITNAGGSASASLLVPIEVAGRLRLEPEFGFSRSTLAQTVQLDPRLLAFNPFAVPNTESTTSSTNVGTGVFFTTVREKLTLHYGARVGYARSSTTTSGGFDGLSTRLNGFFVGPALGGEYFLSDRFSLGAEIHVRYTSLDGTQDSGSLITPFYNVSVIGGVYVAPIPVPQIVTLRRDIKQTSLVTRASVVARVYLR